MADFVGHSSYATHNPPKPTTSSLSVPSFDVVYKRLGNLPLDYFDDFRGSLPKVLSKSRVGLIRLWDVQELYSRGFLSLDDVCYYYKKWRDQDVYLGFEVIIGDVDWYKPLSNWMIKNHLIGIQGKHGEFKREYRFVKASKRGNDVHRWRVKKRLEKLLTVKGSEYGIFSLYDELRSQYRIKGVVKPYRVDEKHRVSKVLFITLTYNPARSSVEGAWSELSDRLHVFLVGLRKKFGKFTYFRVVECFKSRYPHVHLIVYFKETAFPVFRHFREYKGFDGKKHYAVEYLLEDEYLEEIELLWKDFVRVSSPQDLKDVTGYLLKYVLKCMNSDDEKHLSTMAMLWLYRKPSYVMSRDFIDVIINDFGEENPFDDDVDGNLIYGQCMIEPRKYVFLGVFPSFLFGGGVCDWFLVYEDPPPAVWLFMRLGFA